MQYCGHGKVLKTKNKKANACHVIEEHVPSSSSPRSHKVVRVRKSQVQIQTDYPADPVQRDTD